MNVQFEESDDDVSIDFINFCLHSVKCGYSYDQLLSIIYKEDAFCYCAFRCFKVNILVLGEFLHYSEMH